MAGCVNYISPHVTRCSPRASLSLSFSGDSVHSLFRRSPSITAPRFQVVVAAEKAEPPPSPLKIMISGAPASGKGTQCELITQKYGLVHISAGDLLRAEIASGSENGRLAKEHMEKGQLVPNEIVVMMVKDRLSQTDAEQNGWLLDGYPRSSSQATALQGFGFHPDLFIVLEVPEDILVERVVGRRLDPVTGKIYHLKYSPPETEEIAARLTQRFDDTEEKASQYLYICFCFSRKIKGNRPKEEVFTQIDTALSEMLQQRNTDPSSLLS
uniref:adenylate kinase n=1 Tax=Brassica campestris TaxID=3711 RepID=M4F8W4_BRACM